MEKITTHAHGHRPISRHFAQMDRVTNASRDAARAASQAKQRRREAELFDRRRRATEKAAA